ncbi:MAG TPA: Mov34/MPN/PAD-1 family protein, partial [Friedmanniella sp.]
MLRISQALVDGMVAHARADHPDEACGVIGGPEGSDTPA